MRRRRRSSRCRRGDYLVHVAIPDDATGKPMYKVTGEEDINIGNGDQIIPQVPPPACAGALHTVDVAGVEAPTTTRQLVGDGGVDTDVPVGVDASRASTPVDNATFLDIGGSPYEGQPKPRCDTKLVDRQQRQVDRADLQRLHRRPGPGRACARLIIDDINFSTDPRSIMFGEKAGVPFAPVGIYDFDNRLVYTTESDFNGIYDVLMPSTNHISCPTPSGVCANMYRFVANDPGIPGRLNPNYNPRYRTIAAEFEAIPGVSILADLAPTQVGLTVESPATGLPAAVICALDAATPQLFAVSQPYVKRQRHVHHQRARLRRHQGRRPGHARRHDRAADDRVERPSRSASRSRRHADRARTSSASRRTTARAPSTA